MSEQFDSDDLIPITRLENFMSQAAGGDGEDLIPVTRLEKFIAKVGDACDSLRVDYVELVDKLSELYRVTTADATWDTTKTRETHISGGSNAFMVMVNIYGRFLVAQSDSSWMQLATLSSDFVEAFGRDKSAQVLDANSNTQIGIRTYADGTGIIRALGKGAVNSYFSVTLGYMKDF